MWLLLSRVGDVIRACEDLVYSKYGLTSEQFELLACIKARGPLRLIDLASILERTPRSTSFIVDRMVKAGLVSGRRDRKERRAVSVSMTDKGRGAVESATPAGWELIRAILSPLPDQDQRLLANALERVKHELVRYLNSKNR